MRVVGVSGVEGYAESRWLGGSRLGASTAQLRRWLPRYRDGERVDRTIPVVDTRGRLVDVFEIMLPVPG